MNVPRQDIYQNSMVNVVEAALNITFDIPGNSLELLPDLG